MNKPSAPATIRLAVALHYDGEEAPRVTAKGGGDIAEKILEIAKKNNIAIEENEQLVRVLSQVNLGDEIPENLYIAIAEIIAFTYYVSGRVPEGFDPEKYE
ncbi:MAG: type III secretion protein [Gammaproteobacteria bacterium]|nr:type III secretion protein [Gammaproteobacteria bacterium]